MKAVPAEKGDTPRSKIAIKAADSRWGIPQATHRGEIVLGTVIIPCAVLADGRRVLTDTGITYALLGARSGAARVAKKAKAEENVHLPVFLAQDRLNPFLPSGQTAGNLDPIKYRDGTRIMTGFDASALPAACEVWLKARDAGALHPYQADKAQRAEMMMRGLAHIGITALVDEATGYQEVREQRALQAILDQYLRSEFAVWAKRFPDEFYKQMFRLKGWKPSAAAGTKPILVGYYTKDVVYSRLAPGIVEELAQLNPKDANGRRKVKHHQWLSDEIGHSALSQHLYAVINLMKISSTWAEFMNFINIALPKKNTLEALVEPAPDSDTGCAEP